jgi:hypothetical protein
MLAGEWKSSASWKTPPFRDASREANVDFPHPATPITTITRGSVMA